MVCLVVLATACGQGDEGPTGIAETEIVELDTDGAVMLGSDMAACLREIVGVEVADDFLLAEDAMPFDFAQATPAQEQDLIACFNGLNEFGDQGTNGDGQPVLQVEAAD